MRSISHDEVMAETFRNEPAYAAEFLNSILEDGDQAELRLALRQIAKAFGAEPASLQTPGPLELTELAALLKPMGFRLVIQPMAQLEPASPTHPPAPNPEITAPQNAL